MLGIYWSSVISCPRIDWSRFRRLC